MSTPDTAVIALWIAWALSWFAASLWSARTLRHVTWRERLTYRLPLWLGGVMLFCGFRRHFAWAIPLWQTGEPWKYLCDVMILCGFLFCWWARLHLGRLWSSDITRKEDHVVVESGPYAVVRHPIYTGVLAAAFATAAFEGTLLALAGAAVMAAAFTWKARMEEEFLRAELGAAAYDAYARRVAMLVPFARF